MSLGSKPAEYQQLTAPDLQGQRGHQISLLNSLFDQGTGADSPFGQMFGNMGSAPSALQRQSSMGIGQFLNQPAPEQRAFDQANPALQSILGSNPGAGIMDALRPHFEQNLALANQQGGRFGSANAILKSQAVNDYNLLGAQAAQQGQQAQLQAAQILGVLGGQAGQNPFSRMLGAYGVGQQDAAQQDLGTQRRLQMLMQLLGVGQQAALGGPTVQTKEASPGWGGILGSALGTGLGAMFGGVGAGIGGSIGGKIGGQIGG